MKETTFSKKTRKRASIISFVYGALACASSWFIMDAIYFLLVFGTGIITLQLGAFGLIYIYTDISEELHK